MSHESEHREPAFGSLNSVEQALAGFCPTAPRLDRDRLMFLAGQASAPASDLASEGRQPPEVARPIVPASRRPWPWPASTAALAATSLALLVVLLTRSVPQPQIVYRDRVVALQPPIVPPNAASPAAETPDLDLRPAVWQPVTIPQNNYVQARDVALRLGLDALGSPPSAAALAAHAPTYREILNALVPQERQTETAQPPHM